MQNFSNDDDGQDDSGKIDAQEKSRRKNNIQREMIMLESDFRKLSDEKAALDMEIRQFKKDEAHIKINLQEKQARLGKVEFELLQLDTNLKSLKKKLNLL
jgi:chromosome segregation ATPase